MRFLRPFLRRIGSLDRFMRRDNAERWLIVEAGVYLVGAKIATRAMPTRALLTLGRLETLPSVPGPATLPGEIEPAIDALEKGTRRLDFANCLVRAVALRMLLARREIATELHIGARKDEQGQFAAHAWLTWNGTILVGGEDATVLYRELVASSHASLR